MATETSKDRQQIVEASTVIVFRNGTAGNPEILMIQRAKQLAFAGSAVVFPGGKVHESDRHLAAQLQECGEDAAARIACIREVIEETGLVIGIAQRASADEARDARMMLAETEDLAPVLNRFGWRLDLGALTPFARWVPTFKPGRIFDTRFYLADLGTGGVELSPDLGEATRLFWATASSALSEIESGEIKAIYPTRRNLERLARFNSFSAAVEHARTLPVATVSPWISREGSVDMLRIPDGLGYPVTVAPLSQISLD